MSEQEHNLPGNVNSNDTHTRDLERAEEISTGASGVLSATRTRDEVEEELEKHLSRKNSRKKSGLQNEKYPLMDLEKGLVGWESQEDPMNPRNYADSRKWLLLGFVAAITFLSPVASTMPAPAVVFVSQQFHNTSDILSSFSVSIFVLGFAVGPLFFSPLSEIYGRRIVLNAANLIFVAFNLGCALAPNLSGLLAMRFFSGTGGSACLTIGSGVIVDLFVAEQRGLATAIYSLGILFGPVVGPICGGFIAERAGWRWVFWVIFIASAIVCSGILVFNRETNPIILIERKTHRLRKELSRPELRSIYTHMKPENELKLGFVLSRGMWRPVKLLFKSPIVFLLSLYMSFVAGLLYLLFTTISTVFVDTYHWSSELTGLAYLGVGLGFLCSLVIVARTSDATILKLSKNNGGVYEPEMRLPACIFFGMFIPISFFWYGWTADKHVHWMAPIIGLAPFGFGLMGVMAPIQTYLIDAFPTYAASAMAGLTTMRCLFGALLPLAGPKMYQSLGLGWGNSLLGFVALGLIPGPILMYKYGGLIRKKYPVKL